MSVAADLVIYRCAQEDGTVAFQEKPCAKPSGDSEDDAQDTPEDLAPAKDFFDFENPFEHAADNSEREELASNSEQQPPTPASKDRAACEKTTRDAIDAIDAEMRKGYTKEEGQRYLTDLLELTRELRACKRL